MLRLDPCRVEQPTNVDDVLSVLAREGTNAKLVAGGTDVLPNMKHGLFEPSVLVHIGRVKDLAFVRDGETHLHIGPMTTLHDVAHHALVALHAPGLALAAAQVAGPQLRRMGTLGGNIALDTRCLYYNQTYFWRESLGFCLKKDGSVCHVVAGGKKCVAAASNDAATMLLALGASLLLRSPRGERTVMMDAFYVADGQKNNVLAADELIVGIDVPKQQLRHEAYEKLRHRHAIDFPLLCVAAAVTCDDAGLITDGRICVSALQARPFVMSLKDHAGRAFDEAFVAEVSSKVHARSAPMTNIADDPAWRKAMVPVLVRRALVRASPKCSPSGGPFGESAPSTGPFAASASS